MKKYLIAFTLLGLTAIQAEAANCNTANSIVKVQNLKVGAREYVDFWVKKPFTGTLSITAAATGNFTQDGSGDPISVGGNTWTDVKFSGMDWTCSSQTLFTLPKPIVKDIKNIGQFEGQIEYVIGRLNKHYLGQTTTNFATQQRIRLKFGP
jgi:hypothetical protein